MTAAQESFYIQQLKLGDTCSFQILYEHYYKRIFCYGKCLFPHCEDDLKDGYQDIFISRSGWFDNDQQNKLSNLLFINNKDLTFTESARSYGLDDAGFSTQAVFFDMIFLDHS